MPGPGVSTFHFHWGWEPLKSNAEIPRYHRFDGSGFQPSMALFVLLPGALPQAGMNRAFGPPGTGHLLHPMLGTKAPKVTQLCLHSKSKLRDLSLHEVALPPNCRGTRNLAQLKAPRYRCMHPMFGIMAPGMPTYRCPRSMLATIAPKARTISAWGNAPGSDRIEKRKKGCRPVPSS